MTSRRISRRRALQMAAITGASAGAIALVGCGDDDDGNGDRTPSPGVTPVDEGPVQMGGVFRGTLPIITGMDPHPAGSFIPHAVGSYSYSRLMRFKTVAGVLPQEERYTPVFELAQSVENPDELTYVFQLNPNARFHDVEPTNGRTVTAEDVINSYNRYVSLSPNAANFTEVIDTIEATGAHEVTVKLKEPFGLFLHRMASYQDLWIIPNELVEAEQTEQKTVGSGPFIFELRDESVIRWRRNPDYFETDANGNQYPFVDTTELAMIPDQNQVISQFVARQLDTIFVPPALVGSIRSQRSDAIIDEAPRNILNFLYFEPASFTENKPPFNDERVRQGFSHALDRAALLNLISDRGGFWPTIPLTPGFSEYWWLDPQGSDFGENAKYFEFDPAEARALFEAAEVGQITVPMHFSSNVYNIVVPYYDTVRQAMGAMLRESGITINEVPEEYSSEYIVRTFEGQFDGMALGLESVFSDVAAYWTNMFYPRGAGGGRNHSSVNDTELNDNIRSMLQLQDVEEIRERGFDLQRYLAEKMYYVPIINPVEFSARQPTLRNVQNVEGPTTYAVGTEGTMQVWKEA